MKNDVGEPSAQVAALSSAQGATAAPEAEDAGAIPIQRRTWSAYSILALKLVVTSGIIAALLTVIDVEQTLEASKRSFGPWLLAALIFNVSALLTSTWKWDVLLRGLGVRTPLWELVKFYAIGFFASSFLPGVVGGDVVRWHLTGRRTGMPLQVAATILAERFTGAVALLIMSLAAIGLVAPELATGPVLALLGAISVALVVGVALTLNRRLATMTMYRLRHLRIRRFLTAFYKLHRTLRRFPRRALMLALSWSFLFYACGGVVLYLICRAFSADLTVIEAVAEKTLVCLLTMIPISLGGLGLSQAGDVYLLGILGVNPEHAFGISIMRQLIGYAYVLLGGALFVQLRNIRPHTTVPGPAPRG